MENVTCQMHDEACMPVASLPHGNGPYRRGEAYQIINPAKRCIDPRPGVHPVIRSDGVPLDPADSLVLWECGIVIFYRPRSATASVTMSGWYLPVQP